jgi:plasmid stabilization system protein ParE
MDYSLVIREQAGEEFADAYSWYEEQQYGLGDLFEIKVKNKLTKICSQPFHYKDAYKKFHEALTDVFLFLIVYTIDEEEKQIVVIAIFHASRNPKKKFRK